MKLKLLCQASLAIAMALALIGVLKDVNPTRAIMPLPVQPFAPQATGGLSTTQLGQDINPNYTATQILAGDRTAGGYGFYAPGFSVDLDKLTPDGTTVGTVTAEIDVGCDGTDDHMYLIDPDQGIGCADKLPLGLTEETTVVQGTPDKFLIPIMPPYPWLARHKAAIKYVCLSGNPVPSPADLNTIYTAIPFSPNGGAKAVATLLGGEPGGPPSGICLDTPSNSESTSTIMNTPPVEGDIDGPCNTATNQCADAGIYGLWTSNTVSIASAGSTTIPVQKHLVNNGPEDGSFKELWDVESTNTDIVAAWPHAIPTPGPTYSETVSLLKGVDTLQSENLSIECHVAGDYWGLVVVKNILAPLPAASPLATEDTYLDDNASVFTVLVKCGSPATIPEVDKQVATIKTVPDHVAIATSGTAPVAIDALMANRATGNVLGDEWLVAEAVDADATLGSDLTLAWTGSVTVTNPSKTAQTPTTTSCGTGCIKFQVNEWPGQADVNATLNVTCPATTPTGLYPVVVKAIDAPAAGAGFESTPSDNAQRKVITVRCGGADPDDKEDGAGLYPVWNIYKSGGPASTGKDGDIRKPFKSPPSFPSDTGYVERTIQLECYWMDSNGCDATHGACDGSIPGPGQPDGVISAEESWHDPDMPAGGIGAIDSDGDCLVDPAVPFAAQPGHPVDIVDAPSGIMCDTDPNWINYREDPLLVHNDKSADTDCDGIVDGIEKAWGSNPLLPDSDGDGARDFVEMFQFINPVNPDTDGDGYKDGPVSTYGDNYNTNVDNCPSVANGGPFQLNSDGHRRDNGANLNGLWASNPNQDKLGNACDVDNDNDNALDVYEGTIGTNPLLLDTDGDTINDGAEIRRMISGGTSIANPNNAAVPVSAAALWGTGSAASLEQVYYRGCHVNVNDSYTGFGVYIEDTTTPGINEMDLDGDGVKCGWTTDKDSDNGHGNAEELNDTIEAYGYNLSISSPDTDGDGCDDWCEISDVNGDRACDGGDQGRLNRRVGHLLGVEDPVSDKVFDINKDGFVDGGDQGRLNRNICVPLKKDWGCTCGSEN